MITLIIPLLITIFVITIFVVRYLALTFRPFEWFHLLRKNQYRFLAGFALDYFSWFPPLKVFTVAYGVLATRTPYTTSERWAMVGLEFLMWCSTLLLLFPLEAIFVPASIIRQISGSTYGICRGRFGDIEFSEKIMNWYQEEDGDGGNDLSR